MYNDQLEPKRISINSIFLDPNNPRFWSEETRSMPQIPDSKITEESNQSKASVRITAPKYESEELQNSILRNGFLTLDRIVVRAIEGQLEKYVVIEGNRRLAALKAVRDKIDQGLIPEADLDDTYLQALKASTDTIEVLVYRGNEKDIAWILQGIRHIGGIKDWEPAQQAKLVAEQIEKEGLSLTEAGQRFGLSAIKVGKRYRSYKALEQMRNDEEYQSKAENDYYSLFEEAIGNKVMKQWLGWDDSLKKFTNIDNLKQFYSWIVPDNDHEKIPRRIHNPRHVGYLARLIATKQDALIDRIDRREIEIEAAHQKLKDADYRYDWEGAFKAISELLGNIPNSAIDKNPSEISAALELLETQILNLRKKTVAVDPDHGKVKL